MIRFGSGLYILEKKNRQGKLPEAKKSVAKSCPKYEDAFGVRNFFIIVTLGSRASPMVRAFGCSLSSNSPRNGCSCISMSAYEVTQVVAFSLVTVDAWPSAVC